MGPHWGLTIRPYDHVPKGSHLIAEAPMLRTWRVLIPLSHPHAFCSSSTVPAIVHVDIPWTRKVCETRPNSCNRSPKAQKGSNLHSSGLQIWEARSQTLLHAGWPLPRQGHLAITKTHVMPERLICKLEASHHIIPISGSHAHRHPEQWLQLISSAHLALQVPKCPFGPSAQIRTHRQLSACCSKRLDSLVDVVEEPAWPFFEPD